MENKKKITTQELVITALFIALVYVATWLINIRLPLAGSGGLIHLGNVPLFIGAMLFGRRTGAIAGACGMGLFDIMSGAVHLRHRWTHGLYCWILRREETNQKCICK